jgi:FkbM family methyltransferase
MKNVCGVWLPDAEEHFARALSTPSKGLREVDGLPAYGYDQIERAIGACRRRRHCVDIGAHVGLWSMWLVKHFGWVEAFEPVKVFADILERNVQETNYTLHRAALGERVGRVSLKIEDASNTGHTYVAGDGEIPLSTLDSFKWRDVDLIKIDVEGYELPVLRGAQQTLLASQPIVVIEQRGLDAETYGGARDEALWWLERVLGMRRLAQIHYDYILGW